MPVRNVELEREERQAIVVRQWVGDAGLEFSGGKKAGNKKTLVLKHVRLQKGYCGMHGGRLEPLPLIRFILSGGKKTPSGYEKDPPFPHHAADLKGIVDLELGGGGYCRLAFEVFELKWLSVD